MYSGEEIVHATASENLSFATGWLFLSIALGSIMTFTFFAAISTSFYCCQKPIKKDDKDTQSLVNQGNPVQKLFFPNVPPTVYPTTQSILQQEDNEVVDSLNPAYRELPSAHFSYISSFNGSITIDPTCCGNQQSTIYPNSTKSSIHPHTSSEQLNIHPNTTSTSSDQFNIASQATNTQQNPSSSKPNLINDSSISIHIASLANDPTTSQQNPSSSNHHPINDSSLSIHIINAPEDPQRCMTSSTSGIISEGDLTVQTEGNKNSRHVLEPAMNGPASNDQRLNEPAMNDGRLNKTALNDQRIHEQRLDEPGTNDQRACTKIFGPTENAATLSAQKTNHNASTYESSRGASSFGGVELSPKTRAFSPDYYALTFRREGSGLSDVSCSSRRGASAFATCEQPRTPIMVSPNCVGEVEARGASVFGQASEVKSSQPGTYTMKETADQANLQTEILNSTQELLLSSDAAKNLLHRSPSASELIINSVHSEVIEASPPTLKREEKSIQESIPSYKKLCVRSNTRPNSQASMKSVHTKEKESRHPILQCENVENKSVERATHEQQNTQDSIKSSSYKSHSAVVTNTRSNSRINLNSYRGSIEKDERANGIALSDLSSQKYSGNNYSENSISNKLQIYNSSEVMSNTKPNSLTNNHIIPNSKQHGNLDKPIITRQNTPRDNTAPITILQNVAIHSSEPVKYKDTKSIPTKLNTTYQSLRGASQLGRLGDDDGVCSDSDALWDSVSLSFAYESPSEEDAVSRFGFKEN